MKAIVWRPRLISTNVSSTTPRTSSSRSLILSSPRVSLSSSVVMDGSSLPKLFKPFSRSVPPTVLPNSSSDRMPSFPPQLHPTSFVNIKHTVVSFLLPHTTPEDPITISVSSTMSQTVDRHPRTLLTRSLQRPRRSHRTRSSKPTRCVRIHSLLGYSFIINYDRLTCQRRVKRTMALLKCSLSTLWRTTSIWSKIFSTSP